MSVWLTCCLLNFSGTKLPIKFLLLCYMTSWIWWAFMLNNRWCWKSLHPFYIRLLVLILEDNKKYLINVVYICNSLHEGSWLKNLFSVHHKLVYQSPVEQSNVRQMRDVWKKMVLPSVLETLVKIAKERSSIL